MTDWCSKNRVHECPRGMGTTGLCKLAAWAVVVHTIGRSGLLFLPNFSSYTMNHKGQFWHWRMTDWCSKNRVHESPRGMGTMGLCKLAAWAVVVHTIGRSGLLFLPNFSLSTTNHKGQFWHWRMTDWCSKNRAHESPRGMGTTAH